MISEAIQQKPFVKQVLPVETNIIIFELDDSISAVQLVDKMKQAGIFGYAIALNRVRLVVHLDITPGMVEKTIEVIKKL